MATQVGLGEFDTVVVGGGLVGAATAYGLTKLGERVAVLDEGDMAVRASRGNFALIWVQSKGFGMPGYASWTVGSSDAWEGFAGTLKAETDVDVHFQRPGGFMLALSEAELEKRADTLNRFHNQSPNASYTTTMMDHDEVAKYLPAIGPEVVGGSFCPVDGHVNSLKLFRALHTGLNRLGARYLPNHSATSINREGGVFRVTTPRGVIGAGKVVLAAGNANLHLAPMVGLDAPMRPERGQILVTERVQPFMPHPVVTVRQTDEGTVMIGDSKEEGFDPAGVTLDINFVLANRAARMFPLLAKANIVRSWRAIRVMTADGFPIYDQSTSHPGAFVVTCHSGVTLAAAHALMLAPMIHNGRLDDSKVGIFSARRFDVPKAA